MFYELIVQERQREMERTIAQQRLLREALGSRRHAQHPPGQLRHRLGRWLIASGWQLLADVEQAS